MANIIDYVTWRGDLTIKEKPFNEVDNLILTELVYFDYDTILEKYAARGSLPLKEIYSYYKNQNEEQTFGFIDPMPLMEVCASSVRFGEMKVENFINIIDCKRQIQFAAATFLLDDGSVFVSYRGTDNTIVGWREDFNSCFLTETPAQAEAVHYLEEVLNKYDCPVIVGGHSKGGNLAIYAASFCKHEEQHRITTVYSNDGLGFNDYVLASKEYQETLEKVHLIIPENSIVSILFPNKEDKEIIKCSVDNGAKQHDPYTWLLERDTFLRTDKQTDAVMKLDETITRWLDSLDEDQRRDMITTIFDLIEVSGASTIAELNNDKRVHYSAIIKAFKEQSAETKNMLHDSIKKFFLARKDVKNTEKQ